MALYFHSLEDGTWRVGVVVGGSGEKEEREGWKNDGGLLLLLKGGCQSGGSLRGNELKVASKSGEVEPRGKRTRKRH